ncbi:MAG: ABC transporter permease [Proteobacteria bacterium]|jgi:capsular polysaccharide transport system permease protein|nr:ABC transporter permease [Pseudomonadota bacterium]
MNALKAQFNVILALIIKELQVRFGTKKLGYFWLFLEPILHIVPFFFIRKILGKWQVEELIIFLVTGIVTVMFFTKTVSKIQASVSANRALFAYRQIKPVDIALARLFIECIISLGVFTLMLFVFVLFFQEFPSMKTLPLAIFALVMFVVITFSCGVILMIATTRLTFLDAIIPTVMRLIYFSSGAFFSVSDVPYSLRHLLLLNPIVHVVEILRFNLMPKQITNYGNIAYISTCAFALLGFAMVLYFINKRKLV